MRALVESLRRLYLSEKITKEQVEQRLQSGIITSDEYKYIIN